LEIVFAAPGQQRLGVGRSGQGGVAPGFRGIGAGETGNAQDSQRLGEALRGFRMAGVVADEEVVGVGHGGSRLGLWTGVIVSGLGRQGSEAMRRCERGFWVGGDRTSDGFHMECGSDDQSSL
jgi:hypothetical protein